ADRLRARLDGLHERVDVEEAPVGQPDFRPLGEVRENARGAGTRRKTGVLGVRWTDLGGTRAVRNVYGKAKILAFLSVTSHETASFDTQTSRSAKPRFADMSPSSDRRLALPGGPHAGIGASPGEAVWPPRKAMRVYEEITNP